ncbi:hypothetical protein [Allohahella marinimesophila]|uniref:Uncharacterized protein n=1 Tax=Allohahella marinimesophila TaxID=1054972 RepID=A0ABP7PH13_9GAMM
MKSNQFRSHSSIARNALTALVFSFAVTGLVLAKVEPREDVSAEAEIVEAESTVVVPTVAEEDRQKRSNLRCWQDGILLFEETNLYEAGLSKSEQSIVFERMDGMKQGDVVLIESGTALCLFKQLEN